ncbi:RecX family transcriptional regulator [Paenibacillus sp. D51F]
MDQEGGTMQDSSEKVVTKVEPDSRKRSYYWICLDGNEEPEFSVHEDILVKYRLLKGSVLSSEELEGIQSEGDRYKAYASALYYAGFKMRTAKEMADYLKRKEYTEPDIRYAVERLQQEKVIDDRDYARMYAAQKVKSSQKGRRLIRQELEQRGVSKLTAGETIEALDVGAERDAAFKAAAKKWRSLKGEDRDKRLKLTGFLLRRGFQGDLVREAVRHVSEGEELETEGLWLDN